MRMSVNPPRSWLSLYTTNIVLSVRETLTEIWILRALQRAKLAGLRAGADDAGRVGLQLHPAARVVGFGVVHAADA